MSSIASSLRALAELVSTKVEITISNAIKACKNNPFQVAVIFSLAIGLNFVISIGPTLQSYASGIITSDESSIYASAYAEAVTVFPTFQLWIEQASDPGFILVSVVLALVVARQKKTRPIFVVALALVFISLTILDSIYLWMSSEPSGNYIATNLLGNAAGAPLIAGVTVLFLVIVDFILKFTSDTPKTGSAIAILTPAVMGLAISTAVFLIASLMYRTTPVKIDASFLPPSNGYYRGEFAHDKTKFKTKPPETFSFFSKSHATEGSINWVGMSDPLSLAWKKSDSATPFDVTISYYKGCYAVGESELKLPSATQKIGFHNIESLAINLDPGLAEFEILSNDKSRGYFQVSNEDLNSFSAKETGKSNEINLGLFTGTEETISVWNPTGPTEVYVNIFQMGSRQESKTTPLTRKLTLAIDGNKQELSFFPNKLPKMSGTIKCETLENQNLSERSASVATNSLMFGFLLSIKPRFERADYDSQKLNQLTIEGANGWFEYKRPIRPENNEIFSEGETDFLVLNGTVKHLSLASEILEGHGNERFQFFGGMFDVSLNGNGTINVNGKANAVFRNEVRVNKTRWEQMEFPARSLLLIWLAGIFLAAFRLVTKALQDNRAIKNLQR